LSSSPGATLIAASVMISTFGWSGTSRMKQWVSRRSVRSPVSRRTTALISSSVLSEPFISISAPPSRTTATAFSADSWLCAASMILYPLMSSAAAFAAATIRSRGPTRIGAIRPAFAASTAPVSEASSHGWATAVGVGGSDCTVSIRRWYASRVGMFILRFLRI
jgi:hypothetical protein